MRLKESSLKRDRQQVLAPLTCAFPFLVGRQMCWSELWQPDCDFEDRHHTLSVFKQKESRLGSLLTSFTCKSDLLIC